MTVIRVKVADGLERLYDAIHGLAGFVLNLACALDGHRR